MNPAAGSAGRTESLVDSILLLSPDIRSVPPAFEDVDPTPDLLTDWLGQVQRMRGRVYLSDGAIHPQQLTPDGRHFQDADLESWHVVGLDRDSGVIGCARHWQHANPVSFEDLGLSRSALARDPVWGDKLRAAVDEEIAFATRHGLAYVEVGGWAVSEQIRGTPEALRIALASYSLARLLGGCIGITTATVRHHSSTILRRIGGRPLSIRGEFLPTYFDPRYGCEMEIVCFDSRDPNPKYEDRIEDFRRQLTRTRVVCGGSGLGNLGRALAETRLVDTREAYKVAAGV